MIIRCFGHNSGERKQSFSSRFHFYWSRKWKEMKNNLQLYQLYRLWWDYFGKLTIYFGKTFFVNELFRGFRLRFPKWEVKVFYWNLSQIYCCWFAATEAKRLTGKYLTKENMLNKFVLFGPDMPMFVIPPVFKLWRAISLSLLPI